MYSRAEYVSYYYVCTTCLYKEVQYMYRPELSTVRVAPDFFIVHVGHEYKYRFCTTTSSSTWTVQIVNQILMCHVPYIFYSYSITVPARELEIL
jgi:hypothetical protein